jgi:glycosyltransferase involved in cell wall biosynthesis
MGVRETSNATGTPLRRADEATEQTVAAVEGQRNGHPDGQVDSRGRVRAVFLYHNSRQRLTADIAAGRAPDTGLLGSNHLSELGIDAETQAPRSQIRPGKDGLLHRIAWNVRELPVAWELGDADVACSFWTKLFPFAARLRGRPAVVAFNISLCTAYARSSPARRRLMGAALRSTTAVVCLASAQRDLLLRQHELPPERVHMVPLGVDPQFFRPQAPPRDGYVLAVGRDMARDYATFAEAVAGLDARSIIVASERNLSDVTLPRNTELRLDVSYTELRDLYAGAACVVLPTRRYGYPYGADCSGQTVMLDAMAMGRPIVASERATLSDYVEHGETSLLVPPEDPAALRSAIERVLGDQALGAALGTAARRVVVERLTTKHIARQLAPIIREAAEAPRIR